MLAVVDKGDDVARDQHLHLAPVSVHGDVPVAAEHPDGEAGPRERLARDEVVGQAEFAPPPGGLGLRQAL